MLVIMKKDWDQDQNHALRLSITESDFISRYLRVFHCHIQHFLPHVINLLMMDISPSHLLHDNGDWLSTVMEQVRGTNAMSPAFFPLI